MEYKYKRVLLKLSGEALANGGSSFVDPMFLTSIAKVIGKLVSGGVQVAVVTGGGNIIRGETAKTFSRARADDMGMLSTVFNSIAVEDALNKNGTKAVMMTAVEMNKLAPLFTVAAAERYLNDGYVVIIGGGTGNPYFSTDTASILRGCELNVDAILLAKHIDGVYDKDPVLYDDAVKYTEITFAKMIKDTLGVIDIPSACMAEKAGKTAVLFSLEDPENILRAAKGENPGTLIKSSKL